MNYIKGLIDTYDLLESNGLIGQYNEDGFGIVPKYHSIKKVKKGDSVYRVNLSNEHNNYLIEKVEPKGTSKRNNIVYPTTINSGGRTSSIGKPHGISEELKYMSAKYADPRNLKAYMDQLLDWLNFSEGEIWLKTIYDFLKDNDIGDILYDQFTEDRGKIEGKTFVTFSVEGEEVGISQVIQDSWTSYIEYKYEKGNSNLTYGQDDITGVLGVIPNAYDSIGGKNKILSGSNNEYNKDSRLRKGDIFSLSYEASQKAFNLLNYLNNSMGTHTARLEGNKRLIMWLEYTKIELDCTLDDELLGIWDIEEDTQITDNLMQSYLAQVKKGQKTEIEYRDDYNAHILILDFSSDARVAVTRYHKMKYGEYIDMLNYWYMTSSWPVNYTSDRYISKDLRTLVQNLFGNERKDKKTNKEIYEIYTDRDLISKLVEELIIVKMEKERIPIKFYKKSMDNIRKRSRYKNTWSELLTTAMSIYKKYKWDYKKQITGVEVDMSNNTYSYNYGRLMALYEKIEKSALKEKDNEGRQTFVENSWSGIINRPAHMLRMMEKKSKPYMRKLSKDKHGTYRYYDKLRIDIGAKLAEISELTKEGKKPLDDEFILGYYHQMRDLNTYKNNKQEEDTNE